LDEFWNFMAGLPLYGRLLVFVAIAIATHTLVRLTRLFFMLLTNSAVGRKHQKFHSIASLLSSVAVFVLYFLTLGLILHEFGVSLTAYMASASVLGLAIGFGSQGVVQDVVNGVTFIFSDLLDVGDLVEISTQTGIVKSISMRFVELENSYGAIVFIPNRTIANVINYPRGYLRCIVDVNLPGDAAMQSEAEQTAITLMQDFYEQFPGIFLSKPSNMGRVKLSSGREFVRIKFRIWPGRSKPIEDIFPQQVVVAFSTKFQDYKPWMVAVGFELEGKAIPVRPTLTWPRRKQD
tara:strand:- start:37713 stop:38588 length:876 start_codon:yes stop_codon:yes gene_type:complete